ncbi:Fatty acid-binding protein 2 [Eumeta japonica]|uniref:Fatty acid-binding protein 2 n=1 Tax=Eumeta variegata TaxID=151549 RepID=A0A4C1Y185_EUMVA|nr:Fatty acid-binding protein 2 [Eumeta japonica]
MSFFGKRFKRVRSENLDELLDSAHASDHLRHILKNDSVIFSFDKKDDGLYTFTLEHDGKMMISEFRTGEEHEQTRRDGSKARVTYTMNGNVVEQTIKPENGKITHFKREFGDKDAKLLSKYGSNIDKRPDFGRCVGDDVRVQRTATNQRSATNRGAIYGRPLVHTYKTHAKRARAEIMSPGVTFYDSRIFRSVRVFGVKVVAPDCETKAAPAGRPQRRIAARRPRKRFKNLNCAMRVLIGIQVRVTYPHRGFREIGVLPSNKI